MIFTQQMQRIDATNPQEAIKKMANHIKYLQEQLEYTLMNLDSRNIREIDTDNTTIGNSQGTSLGSFIYITGPGGESFTVGKVPDGDYEFVVKGKKGKQAMYMDSTGKIVLADRANFTIDGGEW